MTTFQTRFNDLVIDELPDVPLTGVATLEFDEDWQQLFCVSIELHNLVQSNTLITIKRRNKDQRFDVVFDQIEDALTLEAAASYATYGQFVFHKSI